MIKIYFVKKMEWVIFQEFDKANYIIFVFWITIFLLLPRMVQRIRMNDIFHFDTL